MKKLIAIGRVAILVLCGSAAVLGFVGILALVGLLGYATWQTGSSSNMPRARLIKNVPPPYYFTKEYNGRMYVLKHDPLAEQEGGLRTTGNTSTELLGDWIEQFKTK